MSQVGSFSILTSADVPAVDREALLAVLSSHANVQQDTQRSSDGGQVAIAIIENVAGGVGTALALELVRKINVWRQGTPAITPANSVRIRRSYQPELDLATADDEELLAWLLQKPPER